MRNVIICIDSTEIHRCPVQKYTIDVAMTNSRSNGKVRSYGKINSTLDALDKLIEKLQYRGVELRFVYETGPCGYRFIGTLFPKT